MGFMDDLQKTIDSTRDKVKDYQEQSKLKKEEKEQKLKDEVRFELINVGVKVNVTFPFKELRLKSHSGTTRALATFGFGLVGLAATNNTKQQKEKVRLTTVFQIVEKGVVFKKAKDDGKDLRIPYEDIVSCRRAKIRNGFQKNPYIAIITLLENQEIFINTDDFNMSDVLYGTIVEIINERALGSQFEESGWGLEHEDNNQITSQKSSDEESSDMEDLEKLMVMYEKGLLTDDEFTAMKRKIIER